MWAYMRFYRYRSAPIWRRLDDILTIAHSSRDRVVLIQPFDRQYNSIHGLRNGTTVTNRPRAEEWGALHEVLSAPRPYSVDWTIS